MLIDQTNRMFPVSTPGSFLGGLSAYNPEVIDIRSHSVEGLGDAGYTVDDLKTAMPTVNSEMLYLSNLWRQANGQAPLDVKTNAPTVNVGLSPATTKLAGVGFALGFAFLLSRIRR